ncbi:MULTISPECIES: DUF2867 domain-containing protein [Actinosynnema]|uniref:DUF2867 domain-containing protein n=1 Tax=Actinosynnema TaxID=40566 RepID=UPI0020A37254|nr:DUF2867 domain-containing protein [Actinosynnema pretiosum]MCP2096197.1 Protein of unknown function (DUF2867) [Actinosynnema pretiosum]
MKLPDRAFTELPWQLHRYAADFHVEDVWRVRSCGAGPDDFPAVLAALLEATEHSDGGGLLFAIRERLGALLGWDRPEHGLGTRVRPLSDRLPPPLAATAAGRVFGPFTGVYALPDEAVAELANKTVHGLVHLGWTPDADGHELRMTVLVKTNGRLGSLYLRLIGPFRDHLVYPSLVRRWERVLRDRVR